MDRMLIMVGVVVGLVLISGCTFDFDLLPETFGASGASFVVSGTATVLDVEGGCLAWLGENGVTYHLFQSLQLDNATFDRVTTPGVTSRLEIAPRNDLVNTCQAGTIVEVRSVLEIID